MNPTHPTTDQLWGRIDGDLPPHEAAALDRHVATCPACAKLLADFRAVDRAIRAQRYPLPPGVTFELPAEYGRRGPVHTVAYKITMRLLRAWDAAFAPGSPDWGRVGTTLEPAATGRVADDACAEGKGNVRASVLAVLAIVRRAVGDAVADRDAAPARESKAVRRLDRR